MLLYSQNLFYSPEAILSNSAAICAIQFLDPCSQGVKTDNFFFFLSIHSFTQVENTWNSWSLLGGIHIPTGKLLSEKNRKTYVFLLFYIYVKVLPSQSHIWELSLLCHFIFKECQIFVNEFYNIRYHYEYKIF